MAKQTISVEALLTQGGVPPEAGDTAEVTATITIESITGGMASFTVNSINGEAVSVNEDINKEPETDEELSAAAMRADEGLSY
jgi:hypothetical protein